MTSPAYLRNGLLHDVQAVLAAAFNHMTAEGWRRGASARVIGGVRLVDALNYASAAGRADTAVHMLAFACAAMAVQPHLGRAAHELLPAALADAYLSPDTDDVTLHRLDASIMVRYNAEHCTGKTDAEALLRLAYDRAPEIIAAQVKYRPIEVTA